MKDLYLSLSVEELLADDDFIRFITEDSDNETWKEWIEANPKMREKINEARRLLTSLRFKEEPVPEAIKSALWSRIESSTSAEVIQLGRRKKIWRSVVVMAVAATIALLLLYRAPSTVDIENLSGEALVATLPSESTVELIGHSTISYNRKQWNKERSVHLDGEAIFDVTRGVPFTVYTDLGTVRVLGTKFKVYARENSFYVLVEHGRVEVITQDDSKILTAGFNYVLNPVSDEAEEPALIYDKPVTTYYNFENEPLDKVMHTIEKEFGVTFVHNLTSNQKYRTNFSTSDSLEGVLYRVFWPLDLTYTLDGNRVILKDQ